MRHANDVTDDDQIFLMDPFERAPINYGRERVLVQTATVPVWTWTYFANSAVCRDGLRPETAYMAHLLAGREFLSETYFAKLKAWSCVDDGQES